MLLDERHAEADYAGELTRAVALLEQSGSPEDLARVVEHLAGILNAPGREELRSAFLDWLWVLKERVESEDEPSAPPPDLTLEDVKMTLEERVATWREPWIRQGVEQGIKQGVEQGIERGIEQGKREQLRRLAEVRFGTRTAERLFAALRREDDPQRLDAIAEAVVRCETGDELLREAVQRR